MIKYSSAKSKFIRDKIKKTKFKDRGYIDDLLFLEKVILNEINLKNICFRKRR